MHQHRLYLLSISVTILLVYFSSLHADYLPIDDGGTLQIFQTGNFSISDLFLHGGKEYFRPLAILSLLIDFYLFGGKTSGYHITNILLHLCNAVLVYYLALLLLNEVPRKAFYAFLAGLFFAVHPVNAEAVVWLSCRPDLLCCLFSLLCLVVIFKTKQYSASTIFFSLLFFFLCSLLAKEASFFLPLVIAYYFFQEKNNISLEKKIAASAAITLAIIVYLLMRKGLPNISATGGVPENKNGDVSTMVPIDILAAYGFYIRKLLFPFPLSFTITKINSTLNASYFIIFSLSAVFLWKKFSALRFPIVFQATSLIPPIGAMLLIPIWTPYAERYMYLPSVAISICVVTVLYRSGRHLPNAIVVICILALALPTALRVRLWTKPLLFWQDAVTKAPHFGTSRLVLASEYLKTGSYQKAEENLQLAVQFGLRKDSLKPAIDIRNQLEIKTGRKIFLPLEPGQISTLSTASHIP